MSDSHPIRELGPQGVQRKPLGSATLPTIFLASNVGCVAVIHQEYGGSTRLSLDDAAKAGYLTVTREVDNLHGIVTGTTIQVKSNRLRLAVYSLPSN
jgi:hypothetical protein